jgi:hypothetical membrane protein
MLACKWAHLFSLQYDCRRTLFALQCSCKRDLGAIGVSTTLLWNSQVFLTGVLLFLGMYCLFHRTTWELGVGKRRNLVGIMYLLPGIGTILVSLFPENFILVIHGIAAMVVFVFGAIGVIYAYRLTRSPFRYFSVVLGVISLLSIPVFFASGPSIFGLTERLVVYPYILWAICFGSYLIALQAK